MVIVNKNNNINNGLYYNGNKNNGKKLRDIIYILDFNFIAKIQRRTFQVPQGGTKHKNK